MNAERERARLRGKKPRNYSVAIGMLTRFKVHQVRTDVSLIARY